MKPRDFKLDAYELCRRFQSPGHLELSIASQQHGYQLGLLDATEELRKLADKVKQERDRSNLPS